VVGVPGKIGAALTGRTTSHRRPAPGQPAQATGCHASLLEQLQVFHRGELVANHPVLSGKYQMRILPEHGPGAIARNARLRYSTAPGSPPGSSESTEVQVRDLALYDQLAGVSALEVTP
jgi:hypothetical protein